MKIRNAQITSDHSWTSREHREIPARFPFSSRSSRLIREPQQPLARESLIFDLRGFSRLARSRSLMIRG